jgi:hypothetical protein
MSLTLSDEGKNGELTFELDHSLTARMQIWDENPPAHQRIIKLTEREASFLLNICQTYLRGLGLDYE